MRTLAVALTLGTITACTRPRAEVTWTVRIASEDLRARAAWAGAEVRAGGCDGAAVFSTSTSTAGGAMADPPRVGAGRYGFVAWARDADCVRFAEACEERELPLAEPETIVLTLEGVEDVADCFASECNAGACAGDGRDEDAACGPCECASDRCVDGQCMPARRASRIAAGETSSCALAGGLYCWGRDASLGTESALPWVPRSALIEPATDWTELTLGHNHGCVIRADGTLHCWGANRTGQAGLGRDSSADAPTQVGGDGDWLSVVAGDFTTCGIRRPGVLYCWGENARGELGGSSTEPFVSIPTQVGPDRDWTAVGVGTDFACGLRGTRAFCWGSGDDGRLGNGSETSSTMPYPAVDTGDADGIDAIAVHLSHTIALDADGEALAWGANAVGQLGTGGTSWAAEPVRLVTSFDEIFGGLGYHSCALSGGQRCCWGNNDDAELGRGFTSVRETHECADDRRWDRISTGLNHTCGVDEDGAVYCWGSNRSRQAGQRGDVVVDPARVCLPE